MEKKQFLWDFCSDRGGNSELFPTRRDEKHQKVFFYTNLVPKARLMENLGEATCYRAKTVFIILKKRWFYGDQTGTD